ncbi:MAG: hypothetical protein ACM359_12845, partial [Bacillota bacterium]
MSLLRSARVLMLYGASALMGLGSLPGMPIVQAQQQNQAQPAGQAAVAELSASFRQVREKVAPS